jgi:hypothetical protein
MATHISLPKCSYNTTKRLILDLGILPKVKRGLPLASVSFKRIPEMAPFTAKVKVCMRRKKITPSNGGKRRP